MATSQMNESWRLVRSQIELIWRDVDFEESELKETRGNLNKMVDLIHTKTGDSRPHIVQKMAAVL
jgi:hypothetical protein